MSTPSGLTLVTANAASGRETRAELAAEAGAPDLTAWAEQAAALAPDVLAVQEVDHLLPRSGEVDQTALLVRTLAEQRTPADGAPWHSRFAAAVHGTPGNARTMRSAPGTDAAEPSYGVALLSRHPVAEWRELRMAPSAIRVPVPRPSWVDEDFVVVPDEQRVALAARIEAPVGDVTVVTTHLSFVPWRAAGQLRELVAWARDLPRPLVLLGDLNLPGRVPSTLTGWCAVAAGPTFPAGRPTVQLDHVLVDPRSRPSEPATSHRLAGSDHLAWRVRLTRW